MMRANAMHTSSLSSSTAAPDLSTLLKLQGGEFVRCAYLTILNREPDAAGFNHYVEQVRAGVSKVEILGSLYASIEATTREADLPWLRKAITQEKLKRLPLVGFILKALFDSEGASIADTRLRAIEQQICFLVQQSALHMISLDCVVESRLRALEEREALLGQQSALRVAELERVVETRLRALEAQNDLLGEQSALRIVELERVVETRLRAIEEQNYLLSQQSVLDGAQLGRVTGELKELTGREGLDGNPIHANFDAMPADVASDSAIDGPAAQANFNWLPTVAKEVYFRLRSAATKNRQVNA